MLQLSLLALLLANAGYFAWSQGWMASLGWQPETQSETFRMRQQIRPDAIQVGAPPAPPAPAPTHTAAPNPNMPDPAALAAAAALAAPADAPSRCWQVGTFDDKQIVILRTALRDSPLPATAWELQTSSVNGRWMVYLGKFPNNEALALRRSELLQQGVNFDRAGGTFDPGLSLGRFTNEEAATRELTSVLRKGVRGARVVQERSETTLYTLRLPQVTASMHPLLEALKPALAGKPLRLCEN